MTHSTSKAAVFTVALLWAGAATAQTVPASQPSPRQSEFSTAAAIRKAVGAQRLEGKGQAQPKAAPVRARVAQRQSPSIGHKIAGAAIGAVGGFFLGGYTGARLEPDCDCDDPGLQGFLIGAPIGAIVGGVLGAKFFR